MVVFHSIYDLRSTAYAACPLVTRELYLRESRPRYIEERLAGLLGPRARESSRLAIAVE